MDNSKLKPDIYAFKGIEDRYPQSYDAFGLIEAAGLVW